MAKVMPPRAPVANAGGSSTGQFYRQCRIWHGYLSAFAFLALIFFSITGLLLNHPEWFTGPRPAPVERTIVIPREELAVALRTPEPAQALAEAVSRLTALRGAFKDGEILDGKALIRMQGVSGNSDVTVDLADGRAEVSLQQTDAITMLNQLHRGTNAGPVWRALIDATAVIVLALSLVGYVLFFSLRFRLKTSLLLTGASLLILAGVFLVFVP